MSDIATDWATTRGDWALVGADLARGADLVTAVLISLFTDRAATPDDVAANDLTDPRGFWADDARYPTGSRLWLLDRAKRTAQTLQSAQGYIEEALQWLIDDGVASSIDITLAWSRGSTLSAAIVVHAPESAAYGIEPLVRVQTENVFRLSDVQAWGWNADLGTGEWKTLVTIPFAAGGVAPTPPDLANYRITPEASTRAAPDGSLRILPA